MPMFRRATPEEKEARERLRMEQRERAEASAASVQAAAEASRRQAENDGRRQAFFESPAGLARSAFNRHERVFQCELDVRRSMGIALPFWGPEALTEATDTTGILNSVIREGWELINGSYVFVIQSQESQYSRHSEVGQHVGVKGTVLGYYLFRRLEDNKRDVVDPWDDAYPLGAGREQPGSAASA